MAYFSEMRLAILMIIMLSVLNGRSQYIFTEDFSSSVGWVQVGSNVEIFSGELRYIFGAADSEQRRVYKGLKITFDSTDCWKAEFEFLPVALGIVGGHPFVGHTLLALTAGTSEPQSDCPNIACTGYPVGTQDGIMVIYTAPNPATGEVWFRVHSKDSAAEHRSGHIPTSPLGIKVYLTLERHNSTLVSLSVFSDSIRSSHIPGSPVFDTIPPSVTGLTHVQVGNVARGHFTRELTGSVDNIKIVSCENAGRPDTCRLADVNTFSPNNDQINDLFRPFTGNLCLVEELVVYNRWGQIVHKTEGILSSWNGRNLSGEECPEGVYYFATQTNGNWSSGFVHLFR